MPTVEFQIKTYNINTYKKLLKSNFQHLNRNILEILSSKTEIGLSYIRCMTRRARVGGHNVIQKSAGTENVIGQCQYDFFD